MEGSQIVPQAGYIRIEAPGDFQIQDRLVVVFQREVSLAEKIIIIGVVRIEGERFLKIAHRVFIITIFESKDTEIVIGLPFIFISKNNLEGYKKQEERK